MTETGLIRVFIADDFDIMRQVIQALVERTGDVEVVGEAPHLMDALEEVRTLQPDVIIMNDYLPPVDSALATERFRALDISAPVLIVSMHVDPDLIKRSFEKGANGFMHKDEMGDHLVKAIRHVHRSGQYLSPKAEQALSRSEE